MPSAPVVLTPERVAAASRGAFRSELSEAGLLLRRSDIPDERQEQEQLLGEIDDMLRRAPEFGARPSKIPDPATRELLWFSVTIDPALQQLRADLVERMLSDAYRATARDLEAAVAKLSGTEAVEMQGQLDRLKSAQELADEQQELVAAEASQQWQLLLMNKKEELAAARWGRLTTKDSIATIIGGVLLISMTVTLITAMFIGTVVPELISNAFLLILGYFFGQGASRGGREG